MNKIKRMEQAQRGSAHMRIDGKKTVQPVKGIGKTKFAYRPEANTITVQPDPGHDARLRGNAARQQGLKALAKNTRKK